jgi:hypothetical protein
MMLFTSGTAFGLFQNIQIHMVMLGEFWALIEQGAAKLINHANTDVGLTRN